MSEISGSGQDQASQAVEAQQQPNWRQRLTHFLTRGHFGRSQELPSSMSAALDTAEELANASEVPDAPETPEEPPTDESQSPTLVLLDSISPEPTTLASLHEQDRAKYGGIIGFLTGETISSEEKPKYSTARLESPTIIVSDNTLAFRVDLGSYDRRTVTLAIPLDKPFTPDSVYLYKTRLGVDDGDRVSLRDASDEQLHTAEELLQEAAKYRLELSLDRTLVSIHAGKSQKEYFLASSVQIKAAHDLLTQASEMYSTYQEGPLATLLPQLRDYIGRPTESWNLGNINYGEALLPDTEALAGYVDTKGEIVLGELMNQSRALQALDLEDEARYLSQKRGIGDHDTQYALRKFMQKILGVMPQIESDHLLLFPQPNGMSFERGKDPVKSVILESGPRGYSVGPRDEQGRMPFNTDGKMSKIRLHITEDNFSTGVYTPTEDGKGKNPSDETLSPIFYLEITEEPTTEGGERETYKVYPVNKGLLVQCQGSDKPTYYSEALLMQVRTNVTRKPVIYLYPKKKTKVSVKLDYNGQLTNTYPQIQNDTWNIVATPDSTLSVNGKKYKYLFWDGINGEVEWDWSKGFCVNRNEVDIFLEDYMKKLGLNFAEAQDFITYWAPMMKQNEWNVVSFQTKRYEELAKLMIDPRPDTLIRVFMVFKKVDGQVTMQAPKLKKLKRSGFTVVEWGGSNLDEVTLHAGDRFVAKPSKYPFLFV